MLTRRSFLAHSLVAAAPMFAYPRVTRARMTEETPYDFLHADFAPFVEAGNGLDWPMKCRAIAADAYHFWRGTKALYYRWTMANCRDWYADSASYVISHGDFHLGNIGSYESADGFSKLAFGPVDFDESIALPASLELLNAYVTLCLAAKSKQFAMTPDDCSLAAFVLIDAYRRGRVSATPTRTLVEGEPIAQPTFSSEGKPYGALIEKLCDGDQFRAVVRGGGKIRRHRRRTRRGRRR